MTVTWNPEYDPNVLANRIEQGKVISKDGDISFKWPKHLEYDYFIEEIKC
jgi:hypothetical protein